MLSKVLQAKTAVYEDMKTHWSDWYPLSTRRRWCLPANGLQSIIPVKAQPLRDQGLHLRLATVLGLGNPRIVPMRVGMTLRPETRFCLLGLAAIFLLLRESSVGAELDHRTVARDNFQLHLTTQGNGTPLVLLSGGPGFDADYMLPLGTELNRQSQCIVLEQRGTGHSLPPTLTSETINVKAMVDDIEALRNSMKLKQITLLGHSWGGVLSMAYAARYPQRVHSLILVASGGLDMSFAPIFLDNVVNRASMNERKEIQEAELALGNAADPSSAWFKLFRLVVPLYFFDRTLGEQFMAGATKDGYHPEMAKLIQLDLQKHFDLRKQLAGFSAPVLIIQGHQDPMPEGVAIETKSCFKNAHLIFLNRCGHFPWLEQPKEFYQAVRTFLVGQSQPTPFSSPK